MNGFSKFLIGTSLLGLVAGGIMVGIGFGQGAKVEDVVKSRRVIETRTKMITAEDTTRIDIDVDSADVEIVSTDGDELKVTYDGYSLVGRDGEEALHFPSAEKLMLNTHYYTRWNTIYTSIIAGMATFARHNKVTIELPENLLGHIDISVINGNVIGDLNNLAGTIRLSTINGDLDIYNCLEVNKVNANTINGDIKLDLSKNTITDAAVEINAKTVNGDVEAQVNIDFIYSLSTVTGSSSHPNEVTTSFSHFTASTVNGNINISKI